MREVTLYHYRVPLNAGLVLKECSLSVREGLLVKLSQKGKVGWGEIAPLPTFSRESLTQAIMQTKQVLKVWREGRAIEWHRLFPSVAFGVSMAEYELGGNLSEQADFDGVPLCVDSRPDTLARLASCRLAKLKIGRFSPEQDGKTAARLLSALPTLRLRLDANRAWSLAEANAFAAQLSPLLRKRIEFIEEPCQTAKWSQQFALQSQIAIAWDESSREQGFKLQKSQHLAAIVIKPSLVGTVEQCLFWIEQAHHNGLQAIISSSLESSLGLSQLARFASQHTPHSPAGLDTLNLMSHQLLRRYGDSSLPLLCETDKEYIKDVSV